MISIIVPVYKVEKYLKKCVDSIMGQTYKDFECLLTDDGSIDNCGTMLDEYALSDSRNIVIHQKNGGLSSARNSALDIMSGDYVTFIDSDDYVTNDYVEYLYNLLIENSADVSVCKELRFDDGTEPTVDIYNDEKIVVMTGREACIDILRSNGIVSVMAWCKLYKSCIFFDIRFPIGRIHEDDAIVPILVYQAKKIVIGYKKRYYYCQRNDSIICSRFSLKRFDGVWACDNCIDYFYNANDSKMIEYCNFSKKIINANCILKAKKARILHLVPKEYKMSVLRAWLILYKYMSMKRFEYILAQYHPKLVVHYERLQKIKSLLGFHINK